MELSSWEAYQSNQTFFGSLTAQRVKYYFRKYETARRIAEQQEIERSETYLDPRGTHEDNDISGLLTTHNHKKSKNVHRHIELTAVFKKRFLKTTKQRVSESEYLK